MTHDPTDVAGFAAAREWCRAGLGDFYHAVRFLSAGKRDGICAVLGFCGMIHQAINRPAGEGEESACCSGDTLAERMGMLRERLDEMFGHRLELPLPKFRSPDQHMLHAATRTIHGFGIAREHFLEFAEGRRIEVTTPRYATWNALARYCYHAAGSVGRMIGEVLGLTHSEAGDRLVQLAAAVRLTEILRNVAVDYEKGRIFLPLEDLARYRYSERDLARRRVNERFRELMKFEAERARELYREGAEGICWLADDGSRLAVSSVVMLSVGTLDTLERREYDAFGRRVELSRAEAIRRLPAIWRLAKRRPGEPLPGI